MVELYSPPIRRPLSVQLLKSEYDLIRQLLALLQRETELLESGATTQLTSIMATRQQLTEAIQAAAKARLNCLAQAGIGANVDSIRQCLESAECPGPVRAAWHLLRREYAKLENLNRQNGRFINTQLRYLQTRWSGLLQAASTASLYTSRGERSAPRRAQSISAAA